ncbi:hypothetical protein [Wansuia hejianensis]|uniref:Uncharacterized protein n=1 Tax=Wansuia hejianensis TaxID=2763667 RepID=A0A926F242_9FIRM|nr:hypothetical protein [Wansuia hejianensis]MBC8590602.1 hypothetical protein [Wansuia hejianensis]
MKDFEIHEFEVYGVDEKPYLKFKIKVEDEFIEHDELLEGSNQEDVRLLQAFEKFIRAKVVR